MRLLLDTHALIWWMTNDSQLGPAARRAISDPATQVFVSAASAWEIATKYRLGKLPSMASVVHTLEVDVAKQGFDTLPIAFSHAQRAGLLAGEHRDPFDRMLIAQALTEGMPLATDETLFEQFGVARIW